MVVIEYPVSGVADMTYLHKVPKKKVYHILSYLGSIIPKCRKTGGASTEERDIDTPWHRPQHLNTCSQDPAVDSERCDPSLPPPVPSSV